MKHIFLTAILLSGFQLASAQHVLICGNPLASSQISLEEGVSDSLGNLTDNNDMSVFTLDGVSSASIIFTLPSQWTPKGINIVAGADLSKAPLRMNLYGRNSQSEDWVVVGRYNRLVFTEPYTSFLGRTLASAQSYSEFKLEIVKIKGDENLEIAEIQLLGTPVESTSLANTSNGEFSASDNVSNLWAAEGSDLSTPVTFTNAKAEYGVENSWLQFSFNEPTRIAGYGVTTSTLANKSSRPTSWELLASEDGEEWISLDLRCNTSNLDSDNYLERRDFGKATEYIDFADVADQLHEVAYRDFYRDWRSGKYLIHAWNPDPSKIKTGFNYWWMAHAIDAYIDAYIRTGDPKYQTRARQIRQGMYENGSLWNTFFDDMEWMNLACIRAYENLPIAPDTWLKEAEQLYEWIWGGWNEDDGTEGGIRWNSSETGKGKNSCSNAPAMIGAAKLYQITGNEDYLVKAKMIYNWMLTHSRFDDGFIKDGPNNEIRSWAFTYNQGTWVGGLLELYRITGDREYYDVAVDLLDKTVSSRWYSPDGIMREQGSSDGGLFKGIYIRYITNWVLSGFLDEERQLRYTQFLVENARSMYNCALHKPDYKVMPNWKNRADVVNGENNGGEDGSYHSSIMLSGMFLCESMDMMRRAGLLNDDYSVKNPLAEKEYSHFRLNIMSNAGDRNVTLGGFSLYDNNGASVENVSDTAHPSVIFSAGQGCINILAEEESEIRVISLDGCEIASLRGESAHIPTAPGLYIVSVNNGRNTSTSKILCK